MWHASPAARNHEPGRSQTAVAPDTVRAAPLPRRLGGAIAAAGRRAAGRHESKLPGMWSWLSRARRVPGPPWVGRGQCERAGNERTGRRIRAKERQHGTQGMEAGCAYICTGRTVTQPAWQGRLPGSPARNALPREGSIADPRAGAAADPNAHLRALEDGACHQRRAARWRTPVVYVAWLWGNGTCRCHCIYILQLGLPGSATRLRPFGLTCLSALSITGSRVLA